MNVCKKNGIILSLLCFLFAQVNITYAQISVSPNKTADSLVQRLAGQGVTVSNATLNCAARANGFFNVLSSNLGLDSGIVLTTGLASTEGSEYGINGSASNLASNDNVMPGDASLLPLALQTTYDACDLEFDVVPNGDSIKFDYVFSSEEYKNSVCGPYNDAFAFFISGPGISGSDNMALVPGTAIPVTINSINDSIPGRIGNISNCEMMGPGAPFKAYYIDNSSGTTLTHWGLTDVLQAVHAVIPCNTYHLKIVIADAGDPLYDSGVFLKAGSLHTGNFSISAIPPVAYDTASVFCVKGCLPGHFRVYTSQTYPVAKTLKIIFGGNAISGLDYVPIIDSVVIPANESMADVIINGLPTLPMGTKTLKLFLESPYACAGTNNIVDSASMLIYDTLHIAMLTPDTIACGNESIQLRVAGDSILFYNWSPISGLSNPSIANPTALTAATITYVVTATLPGTACPEKKAAVNFQIKLTPQINLSPDTTICFNTPVYLNAVTEQSNLYYSYSWNGPNGFTSISPDTIINNATIQNSGTYSISVLIDTNNCEAVASIKVNVNIPDTPIVKPIQIFCVNKQADSLHAEGINLLWYSPQGDSPSHYSPVPPTNDVAAYSYYVTETIGSCESPRTLVEVEIKKCCDGNIFVPNAFTPNGDGKNDRFEPVMDYGYSVIGIYIFNRWGQIVFSALDGSWDGSFDGAACEVGTYFYKIEFNCILGGTAERVGDVTLIR